jgi:hypothetical protein
MIIAYSDWLYLDHQYYFCFLASQANSKVSGVALFQMRVAFAQRSLCEIDLFKPNTSHSALAFCKMG